MKQKSKLNKNFVPIVVLLFLLTATFFTWQWSKKYIRQREEVLFKSQSSEIVTLLNQRIRIYLNSLYGIKGLFVASNSVERNEYQDYIQTIDLLNKYPGIAGISYTAHVTDAEKQGFITSVRNDTSLNPAGYPQFDIKPFGTRPDYYVVTYSQAGNGIATSSTFGLDLATDSNRAPTIYKAVDTAQPQATGPIPLFGQTPGADKGFIIFMPLFRGSNPPAGIKEREESAVGVLNAVFRPVDLFKGILQNTNLNSDIDFKVYDSSALFPANLLYASAQTSTTTASTLPKYSNVIALSVAGRPWSIYFFTEPSFTLSRFENAQPWLVLAGGLLISFLLYSLLNAFAGDRFRAEVLAERITHTLQESERKYRSIFESLQDVFYRTDMAGRITVISPSIEKYINIPPEKLIGRNAEEFYPKAKDREVMYQQIRKNGFVNDYPLTLMGKSKSPVYVSLNARIVMGNNRKPEAIEGMLRDVTQRKKAEDELKTRTEELELSHAKDEAVLGSIGDGLVTTDNTGTIVLTNKKFELLLGWKPSQSFGRKLTELVPMFDDHGQEVPENERLITKTLEKRIVTATASSKTLYYKKKDGSLFPVTVTVSPILIGKELIGAVEVFRDTTKEYEVNKAKTEFVSLASHQLRTPLTAINWYAEMLLAGDGGFLNDTQKKFVQEMYKGSRRMVELVNALLNVSRIDMGTFAVDPEPLDVQEMITNILAELQLQITSKKINVKTEYAADSTSFFADPKLMRIIIENLISNAVKYTPELGSISVQVLTYKARIKSKSTFQLIVGDTGCGIPKKQQDKIFTKLFRADNAKAIDNDGNGLGMYLIKSILDEVGGTVTFTSEENKGSTFYVNIPLSGMIKKAGAKTLDT